MTYNLDGTIYAISDEYAMCGCYLDDTKSLSEANDAWVELIEVVCKYYLRHDREELIKLFAHHFQFGNSEIVQTIFRPTWVSSYLMQKATLEVKFQRYKDDGLKWVEEE